MQKSYRITVKFLSRADVEKARRQAFYEQTLESARHWRQRLYRKILKLGRRLMGTLPPWEERGGDLPGGATPEPRGGPVIPLIPLSEMADARDRNER